MLLMEEFDRLKPGRYAESGSAAVNDDSAVLSGESDIVRTVGGLWAEQDDSMSRWKFTVVDDAMTHRII